MPIDLLLGILEHLLPKTPSSWVKEHLKRMQKAKQLVLDKHKEMASESFLKALPLQPEDHVLVKNAKHKQASKLKPNIELR